MITGSDDSIDLSINQGQLAVPEIQSRKGERRTDVRLFLSHVAMPKHSDKRAKEERIIAS